LRNRSLTVAALIGAATRGQLSRMDRQDCGEYEKKDLGAAHEFSRRRSLT